MSQPLGRVTADLDIPRGPDAEHRIAVDPDWLREGAAIEVALPRKLTCSACAGGGCDRCARSGAAVLATEDEPPPTVRLVLPIREPALGEFALRLPHQAGLAAQPDEPRGHLVLVVGQTTRIEPVAAASSASDPGASLARATVTRLPAPATLDFVAERDEERQRLMKRSLVMAAGLILTFVGLLRLSGWI